MRRALAAFAALACAAVPAQAANHVRVVLDLSISMRHNDSGRLAKLSTLLLFDLVRPNPTLGDSFDVTPFIAVIAPGPFTIDGSETAGMFTVPLEIVVSEALRKGAITIAERIIESYILDYDGRRVWGLTGGILRLFVEAWNDETSGVRAAVEAKLQP